MCRLAWSSVPPLQRGRLLPYAARWDACCAWGPAQTAADLPKTQVGLGLTAPFRGLGCLGAYMGTWVPSLPCFPSHILLCMPRPVCSSSNPGTASYQWGVSCPLFRSGCWALVALQGWFTPRQVMSAVDGGLRLCSHASLGAGTEAVQPCKLGASWGWDPSQQCLLCHAARLRRDGPPLAPRGPH